MRSTRNHRGPRRGGRPSCRRYGSSSSFICSEQDTTVVVSGLRAIISHPIPGGLAAGERERGGRGEARGAHAAGGGRRIRGPGAPLTSPNVQQQIRADWGRPRRRHRPRAQLGDGAPSTEKTMASRSGGSVGCVFASLGASRHAGPRSADSACSTG